MKNLYLVLLFSYALTYAQDAAVVNWINQHAVTIEDANPDTPLTYLKQNNQDVFKGVKLFGFGEATHYTKEFFNLKAKFFKYLVENDGVTIFIMEESFGCADDVNEYLKGGEGNADQLTGWLGFGVWRNREVEGLIKWMRTYNEGKPEDKRIKFYGIDNQFGYKTNEVAKNFISKYSIRTRPDFAAFLDKCEKADRRFSKKGDLKGYLEQLNVLMQDVKDNFIPTTAAQINEHDVALHALTVLKQYIQCNLKSSSKDRDEAMADNVNWILKHEGETAKGFIWAHNGHIAKKGMLLRPSMGSYLKIKFATAYYSMGFSFATGKLYGKVKEGNVYKGVLHSINKPFADSFGAVFSLANAQIFFIDVKQAQQDAAMKAFLSSGLTAIDTGGSGYNPLYKGSKEDITELYDGLIFVREISHATYMEERLPKDMRVMQ